MADINAIKKQIEQNSADWHTADEATKKQLEQDNRDLHAMLDTYQGTTSTFDSSTGTWSTTGGSGSTAGTAKATSASGSSRGSSSSGSSSGSSSSGSGGGSSGSSSSGSSGYAKYTGGNARLDSQLASYSQQYQTGRELALSGDPKGITMMRNANDAANQLRNQYGYGAEFADDDINYVKGQIGYGTSSGGGSGQGAAYGTSVPTGQSYSWQVNDYSSYIEAMNKAQQEAALQALKAAYEQNIAALDRTKETIAPQYEQARNQAAGQAELQRRQFNEYAAVNGLNSGVGGQAQLAMNSALQNNLNTLAGQEADALAELELQRQQTELDYNNAIAQAKAEGNYQLAQLLYQEKVRSDEALAAQVQWQAQQDYQNSYFAWQRQQTALDRQFSREQLDWQKSEAALDRQSSQDSTAQSLALQYAQATGDFSGLSAYYTPGQIAQLQAAWQKEQERAEAAYDQEQAEWRAQYGDYSGLEALGVDTGYLTGEGSKAPRAQSAAPVSYSRQIPVTTGQSGSGQTTATADPAWGQGISQRNFAALKQTAARYLAAGADEQAHAALNHSIEQVLDYMSPEQRRELQSYIQSLGGGLAIE